MSRRWLTGAALSLALHASAAAGGNFQADLRARRARLMSTLGPEALMVLWSAPVRTYSRDVDYEYRQDSNFYYLTGIEQEETILVLMPGNATRKEILFVKERNPVREHWQGRMLSPGEAAAASGIATTHLESEFEPFMNSVLAGRPYGLPRYSPQTEFDSFFQALQAGKARLALALSGRPTVSGPIDLPLEFANRVRDRFLGFTVQDATPLVERLRQVKTPYERMVLERSVQISNEAHLAGMRAARPGAYEYEVKAAIEYVYKARGGYGWGYPSIVGSGPNATILHYHEGTRRMEAGDLLLVDAAANYRYLTGDITRTYPVSGTFTPAQREIYKIVLEAQEEGIKAARPGNHLTDIHKKTVEVVKAGLLRLGLISDPTGDQYRHWYTHGASHYIGMDVHDVGSDQRPLEPGMAFTIEPGIYVRDGVLENLPKTPEDAAFVEKVRPAFQKYRLIGIRIEDSFLLTETGLQRLSAGVPRTIEEIERFMQSRPATASR
jgi:Xaa-Pro aminopeptidase